MNQKKHWRTFGIGLALTHMLAALFVYFVLYLPRSSDPNADLIFFVLIIPDLPAAGALQLLNSLLMGVGASRAFLDAVSMPMLIVLGSVQWFFVGSFIGTLAGRKSGVQNSDANMSLKNSGTSKSVKVVLWLAVLFALFYVGLSALGIAPIHF